MLAAYAPPEVQVRLLADSSWPEAVDRSLYLEQLKEITRRGYATSFEEREPGAAAVAVPIVGRSGKVVAALSLSGPVSRLSRETLEQYAVILTENAAEMGLMID
ncbi:Pca operon regulatory protein [compost metagenome]